MPLAPIRGIIFDLDGTLADTMPLGLAGFAHAFAQFADRPVSLAEIVSLLGPTEEGTIRRVVSDRWEEALEAYLAFYEREHASLGRPIAGIDSLLEWLTSRDLRLAIVTGKGPRSGEITLRVLGLGRYIEDVRYGSPLGSIKPRAIVEILAEWKVPGDSVAYVGDMVSDMQAARTAGARPLGAAWSTGVDRAALAAAGAEQVFAAPDELRKWLIATNG